MTTLAVRLTLPAAPITSLQKRMTKGVEHLYYVKLFLTNPAYEGPTIWRDWLEMGFHVAIADPPRGTAVGDRVRVRTKAPSRTPVVSVEATNTDALKDLESVLRSVDAARGSARGKDDAGRGAAMRQGEFARLVVDPLVATLEKHGFEADDVNQYLAMLQRAFDALTDDGITSIELSVL
jgi:hypothetical protein